MPQPDVTKIGDTEAPVHIQNELDTAPVTQAQDPGETETPEAKPTINAKEEKTDVPSTEEEKETPTVPYNTFKAERQRRKDAEELANSLKDQLGSTDEELEIQPEAPKPLKANVSEAELLVEKKFKEREKKEDAIRAASDPNYSQHREQVLDLLKSKPYLLPTEALSITKADALEEKLSQMNQVPDPTPPEAVVDTPTSRRNPKEDNLELDDMINAKDASGKSLYSLNEIKSMVNRKS